MKQILLELDEKLISDAVNVFDFFGLDIQTGVKMFLTRVTKEKSISFLLCQVNQISEEPKNKIIYTSENATLENNFKMTKNGAIRLFLNKCDKVYRTVTFASKNRSAYNYWANPNKDVLINDWSLILNDTVKRKLYLFNIPKNSISGLTVRADNHELIDLQIMYNDSTFTDNRSRVSFVDFKVGEVDY